MATTSPDNIYSPNAGQQYALTQDLLAMADSTQVALSAARTERAALQDALRDALPGPPLIRRRFMSAENVFTNVTAFTSFPNGADATALTGTLTKTRSATRLVVRMYGSLVYRSGISRPMFLGVNINGTNYEVARTQSPEAVNRTFITGEVDIPSIPAGSLTIYPRFRSNGGSLVSFYTEDFVNYSVQEVP